MNKGRYLTGRNSLTSSVEGSGLLELTTFVADLGGWLGVWFFDAEFPLLVLAVFGADCTGSAGRFDLDGGSNGFTCTLGAGLMTLVEPAFAFTTVVPAFALTTVTCALTVWKVNIVINRPVSVVQIAVNDNRKQIYLQTSKARENLSNCYSSFSTIWSRVADAIAQNNCTVILYKIA